MKNRAKCKLCEDILESFHRHDYVTCKCGEISIDGGNDYCKASARDWANFLRIDDEGNTIVVKVEEPKESKENSLPEEVPRMTRAEMIDMLEAIAENIENLPARARDLPVTNYEFSSVIWLLCSILREA